MIDLISTRHLHVWATVKKGAIGFYSKRDIGADAIWFVGNVERCESCSRVEFVPNAPGLNRVEAVEVKVS